MWFCNVLGLCSGSFLEGREGLSIQGFHLCIAAMDCCLHPPSCTGTRAPPADVGLFTATLGTRCSMAMVLLQREQGLPMSPSPPILPLHPPPSAEHPNTGRCVGGLPLLHVPKNGGMTPSHISSKDIYKCPCGHQDNSEPLAWGTRHARLSCLSPWGCPAPQGRYCPGGQHWGWETKLLLEG